MKTSARRILIIEDDPIIANIYRSKLTKAGFEVEIAADGHAGFFRLHEAPFNALLLDLMLPNMDGLDILRKIRAQKRFEKFPVIVFTNAYLGKVAYEAREAGANQVFLKANTSPRQIIDAIEGLFVSLPPSSFVSLPAGQTPSEIPAYASSAAASYPPETSAPPRTVSSRPDYWSALAPESLAQEKPGPDNLDSEALFQAQIRESFIRSAPQAIAAMRKLHQSLAQENPEAARLAHLVELYRKAHSFTGNAALSGAQMLPQMGAILEALLQELYTAPAYLTPSTLHTMEGAISFLERLLTWPPEADMSQLPQASILVLDHEEVSRRAVTYGIQKANLKCVVVADSAIALALLDLNAFNLVVANLEIPEWGGFEFLTRMRAMPVHKTTPVILVGSAEALDLHQPVWGEPTIDWIAKPFLLIELAVKALIFVMGSCISMPIEKLASRRS